MNKEALISAVKEVLRVALFGAVGALISWLTSLDQDTTVVVSLLVLRGVDKYLHKSDTLPQGLSRF